MMSNCLSPPKAHILSKETCLSHTTASPSENEQIEATSYIANKYKTLRRAPTSFNTKSISVEKPRNLKRAFSEILPVSTTPKVQTLLSKIELLN